LGSGGRTACAGPVFYFQESFQRTGGFPEFFDRCLLFYDWQRPFIRWARLDTDSDLIGIEPFTQAVTLANEKDRVNAAIAAGEFVIQRPVDSQFGPDGCLYLLDYGQTWGANSDAQLLKISYQWGNLAPIAKVRVDKTAGREPLTIALSSEGTKDHDQDKLDYEWLLHPGGKQISNEPNPTVTLDQAGNFVVELKVRDSNGAIGSANVPVIVGNSAPEIRFRTPQEGDFFTPGEPVHFELSVQDAEDGRSEDYDELMGARTLLNVNWSKGSGEAAVEPGLAMMKQSDCFNCHAVEQKVVGPALVEIATRYRDQAGAMETSVQRVIKGSSGVWSEVPMLPHESLNPDQVRMMVHWIFGLQPGKSGSDIVRGLTGQVVAPKAADIRMALLEASYTDSGRGAAGPISAQTKVRLRARRLEAEAADEKSGLKVLGGFLGAIDHEHFARFNRLNLQDTSGITVRVASAGQGGRIELRSGSPQGELLAELEVKPTGGWDKWVELSASLRRPANRDDVFVVFVNPGKGGLMNLDWIQFDPISGSGKDNKAASAIAKPAL
ncbi:MAG: carbohydrate-binding protein, partial [Verrucomicrobiota bacterium]